MAINLGIDIGTSSVQIYNGGDGKVMVNQPTVVAVNQAGEVIAAGAEALEMLGKTGEDVSVQRPVKDGGITHFDVAVGLVKSCWREASAMFFQKFGLP